MKSFLGAVLSRPANVAPATMDTPVPMTGRTSGGIFSSQLRNPGTTQALSAMDAAGVVFGIVDRLATSVSLVEWKLWKKAKSGLKEDRTEVTSHAALDLIQEPNRFYSRQELFEAGQQHQDLTGETWLVIGKSSKASIPLELWPIRPDRMEPVPDAKKFLLGYVYRSPDGEPVPLLPTDVVFIRRPDPNNHYRGLGPIRSVQADIDSTRYSMEWNRNFFLNSAEPGGIIEVPKTLSDNEFNELRERWNEQHRGVANAHRVALLEHGKWVERTISQRDMQFTELRGVTEAGIKQAYGFPKFALGEVDDVNRAQGEASIAMFAQWLLVPRLERWKGALNRRVLPQFGSTGVGLEFDYVSPVSEDTEAENTSRTSRVQAVATLVPLGADFADACEKFGLPAIKFEKPEPPAPPAAPGVPGGKPAGKPDPLQALLAPTLRNQAPTDDPELAGVQGDWETALAALLAAWPAVSAAQRVEIRAQVEQAVAANDPAALARMSVSTGEAAAAITAAMTDLAAVSGQRVVDDLAAQGAPVVEPPAPDESMLGPVAVAAAVLLGAGFAAVAARAAVSAFAPGVPPAEVLAAVDGALDGLSDRALSGQLGGVLTRAQNQGRLLGAREVESAAGGDPGSPGDPVLPVDDDYVPQIIYSSAEVNDVNTCLAPDMRVTTPAGLVYAKDVTLDDELLTHAGNWTRPSVITVSEVHEQLTRVHLADGRTLRLTWDHPVLVRDGDGFAWREAGDLAEGDLVVDQATLKVCGEPGGEDFGLRQSPDMEAAPGQVGGLPQVNIWAQRVPVGTVCFDDEPGTDNKVDSPASDLGLGPVAVAQVFEGFADHTFDAGLGSAGKVAPLGAVVVDARLGWQDPELGAAVSAADDDGGSPAGLAAVVAVLGPAVPEGGSAPLADRVDSTVVAASFGAVVVAVGDTGSDLEVRSTSGASLDGAALRRAELGPNFGVGELACVGAVHSGGPVGLGHDDSAQFASGRRVVRVSAMPGRPDGTSFAERSLLDRSATGDADLFDTSIVVLSTISRVEYDDYCGEVYDFTVPGDETFWTEGVLVHNCIQCGAVDGTVYPSWIAAWVDYGGGKYRGCLGRDRCRGTVKATWNPAAG